MTKKSNQGPKQGNSVGEENPTDSEDPDPDDPAEQSADKTADEPGEEDNTLNSGVAGGATVGTAGVAAEAARRRGIDRHEEAGFVEQATADLCARKFDGEVVDDGGSVFAPDDGIDSVIKTGSGELRVQTKHYADPVDDHELRKYADDIDVFAATNGVAGNPDAYDMEAVTASDWPWRTKAKLQLQRVLRGCRDGIATGKKATVSFVGHLVDTAKFVGRKTAEAARWISARLYRTASAIASWYKRRSWKIQVLLFVVALLIVVYLLWRTFGSDDEMTKSD